MTLSLKVIEHINYIIICIIIIIIYIIYSSKMQNVIKIRRYQQRTTRYLG